MSADDFLARWERRAWIAWIVALGAMIIPVLAYAISRFALSI